VGIQPAVLRAAWRSPRGRELARKLTMLEVSPREYHRLPLYVLGAEKFKQDVFGTTGPTAEQEELIWHATVTMGGATLDGKLSLVQLSLLASAYKGSTGILGWSGVAGTLEPPHRAIVAYGLGLRSSAHNRPEDAKMFFREAITHAPSDSSLKRLAHEALDALAKK
jgi:hypothetical protein